MIEKHTIKEEKKKNKKKRGDGRAVTEAIFILRGANVKFTLMDKIFTNVVFIFKDQSMH